MRIQHKTFITHNYRRLPCLASGYCQHLSICRWTGHRPVNGVNHTSKMQIDPLIIRSSCIWWNLCEYIPPHSPVSVFSHLWTIGTQSNWCILLHLQRNMYVYCKTGCCTWKESRHAPIHFGVATPNPPKGVLKPPLSQTNLNPKPHWDDEIAVKCNSLVWEVAFLGNFNTPWNCIGITIDYYPTCQHHQRSQRSLRQPLVATWVDHVFKLGQKYVKQKRNNWKHQTILKNFGINSL